MYCLTLGQDFVSIMWLTYFQNEICKNISFLKIYIFAHAAEQKCVSD